MNPTTLTVLVALSLFMNTDAIPMTSDAQQCVNKIGYSTFNKCSDEAEKHWSGDQDYDECCSEFETIKCSMEIPKVSIQTDECSGNGGEELDQWYLYEMIALENKRCKNYKHDSKECSLEF
ncbi:unnamed protein product [Oppiella nova]|uniref:Uncharacterized protein n=1 Tax=Oppiella nova TaxID=334625 RepID=A0A7R9LV35_9ACAR|nr:unnamed protein product [Oppiella nova]CAG2167137.1 unnamed protein product [Oppiella nova]